MHTHMLPWYDWNNVKGDKKVPLIHSSQIVIVKSLFMTILFLDIAAGKIGVFKYV